MLPEQLENVEFGIAFYDAGLIFYPPTSRAAKADAGQKAAATAWVNSVQSGGGSCFGKGLLKCLEMANGSSAKRNVIIYLGDGCPTCPGANQSTYSSQILSQIAAQNYKRHNFSAIVVGSVCPEFPTALANQNNGSYTRL